jgi:L-ascorbate metabolism protein UlaG (beta-lactamase superfamily)
MKITWWGHSTCTVTLAGMRVLTDPVLTARVAHLERATAPLPPASAVEADVAVVSHLHADHLHLPSLRRLAVSTRLVGPHGTAGVLARRLPDLARRVEEVGPGETVHVGDLEITGTSAWHDGRRLPGSAHRGTALGFRLSAAGQTVWFAGDTGLFDAMSEIGPVDVALVPVGGWGPTLGPHHLDPEQAAEAVRRVGARDVIPIHYGTLWPSGLRRLAPRQFRDKCLGPGRRFASAVEPTVRVHVIEPCSSVDIAAPA